MNEKIRADLEERGRSSLASERKILGYLEASPTQVFTLREICNKNGAHSGSFWAAAYYLASQGKIGLADRKYHIFGGDLSGYGQRMRCVVWHRDHKPKGVTIRPQWAAHEVVTVEPVQPSLFDAKIDDLSTEDLDALIKKAQALRLDRALEERYRGSSDDSTKKVKKVLKSVGVADPVCFLHADEDCAFLTLTTTKAIPIRVSVGIGGACKTLDLDHITIHGSPLIWSMFEAYRSRGAQ